MAISKCQDLSTNMCYLVGKGHLHEFEINVRDAYLRFAYMHMWCWHSVQTIEVLLKFI